MKNLFIALACLFTFNVFAQENFNGNWVNDSDKFYVLYINTNNNEVYEYSLQKKDTLQEKLIFKSNNKITTEVYYNNMLIDMYEYKIIGNILQATSLTVNTTTNYKKQKI